MRYYMDSSRTFGASVRQTHDGGYIIGGTIYVPTAYDSTFLMLIKTNADGVELWHHLYCGSWFDRGAAVITLADGGFVLAGNTREVNSDRSADFCLLRTDSLGDSLWCHSYGGTGWDNCTGMIETLDGGFLLSGSTEVNGSGQFGSAVRVDQDGTLLWSNSYGDGDANIFNSAVIDHNGGYSFAGAKIRQFPGFGITDWWLLKTDADCFGCALRPPEITITTTGTDVHLHWLPVTENMCGQSVTATGYAVYSSATIDGPYTYIGMTLTTEYVHTDAVRYNPTLFYRAMAYNCLPNGLPPTQ
jgi:hypothetical protein